MPVVLRSRLFLGAVIVLAVALCYWPAMRAGFVWDDDLLVTENPLVKGVDSLPYVWGSSAATDYTPLTITVFWLEWRLWSDNAAGYHFVNILLYALSALLLWRVLERLGIPGAWLGALLFAVHPVNVASVAWVAELKNALSLPFYLGAIAGFLRFLETRKAGAYCFALLAAGCALLSKGSTVILPLVLCVCVWWKQRRVSGADILVVLPFFVLSGVAALVTIHFQSRVMDPTAVQVLLPARIARAGHAIWFYLWKDVWPVGLCAIYPKWPLNDGWLPVMLAVGLALLLWAGRRRWGRGLFFAWAYFITALLPVLGILNMSFLDQAYVADWWQQLALPGVTTLVAAGIAMVWPRGGNAGRAGLAAGVALVVLIIGERTWSEASGYESMETHCRRTLACNPDAWTAHNNLGDALLIEGRLDEAAEEYRTALRLKPSEASAHSNLGIIFARQNRLDDAIAEYRAALWIAPENAKFWFNLGTALAVKRQDAEAADAFQHAIDYNVIDKAWIAPRYEMGTVLLKLGRPKEAGRQAEIIVKLNPEAVWGHYLLTRAAAAIGRFDVARTEAETALGIAKQGGGEETIRRMQDALDACKAGRAPAEPEL